MMDFIIENVDNNIKVVLINEGEEVAKATCYFKETPEIDGKNIGCIGEFETQNKEFGMELIKKCEEILKQKNIKFTVAPMNGNTWKKYRTIKYTDGSDLFTLENVNPIEHNDIFKNAGYRELHTYSSAKGLIENAYKSEALDMAEEKLNEEKIIIRKFNKDNYNEDLKKIYNVSKRSFNRNPFYTPINEDEFIKQYEPYIQMVDSDLILIAEKETEEIGFVFCIPNFNEIQKGQQLKTLILKTIAVLPEYEYLAMGNILLKKISEIAEQKGLTEWIFAFMYSNNTSQKMAERNKAEIIREYSIYGKEI